MRTTARRTQFAPVIEHRIIPDQRHRPALAALLTEHQQRPGEARWTNGPAEITVSDRLRRLIPDDLLVGARVYRQAVDLDQPGIPLTAPEPAPQKKFTRGQKKAPQPTAPPIEPTPETAEAVDADLSAEPDPDGASHPTGARKTLTVPTPADLARALSKGTR